MPDAKNNEPDEPLRKYSGPIGGGAAEAAAAAPRSESFVHVSRDFALGCEVHMYVRTQGVE